MGVDLLWLAVSLIFSVLSYLLTPQPKPPTAPVAEKFDIPNAEQGQVIPKIYGTVWQKSPIVAWYGDTAAYPIVEKPSKK